MARPLVLVGWRERVVLPDLGGIRLRAKIDTGAATSALHVENLEFFQKGGKRHVRFHPPTPDDHPSPIVAEALVREFREVRSSNGRTETRCVIATRIVIGSQNIRAEVTLTNRDDMAYPMLIGRGALRIGRLGVDPAKSWLAGDPAWPPQTKA